MDRLAARVLSALVLRLCHVARELFFIVAVNRLFFLDKLLKLVLQPLTGVARSVIAVEFHN